MKNLSDHTDLPYELLTSFLIREIYIVELSKLGCLIGFTKHATWADSLHYLHLLSVSNVLASYQPTLQPSSWACSRFLRSLIHSKYLASGSSSVPKNTSVTLSLSQILHRGGHLSPQKPIHGCLQGRSFLQGSLQGSLSHSSKHNLLQRRWTQAQSQGSCNNQYK